MSLDYGIIKIKRIIDQYKSGMEMKDISFGTDLRTLENALSYLLHSNYFDNYELAFLAKIFPSCSVFLKKNCETIKNEMVLCHTNRSKFIDLVYSTKSLISPDKMESFVHTILETGKYLNRQDIEYDDDVIQIIPYMIINNDDDLLLLERKKGDSRLINWIDFPAGHCNNTDIKHSIYDELKGELNIDKDNIKSIKYVDIIPPVNDKFSVSYYHLGLICSIELYDTSTIINNEYDRHNILNYSDILKQPDKIRYLSNWATYSILKFLQQKEVK